jgi:hypothetical protein
VPEDEKPEDMKKDENRKEMENFVLYVRKIWPKRDFSKLINLKMPFLHWETDRRRDKSAELIRKIRKKQLSSMIDVIETARKRVNSTVNCTECGYVTYFEANPPLSNRISTAYMRRASEGRRPEGAREGKRVP